MTKNEFRIGHWELVIGHSQESMNELVHSTSSPWPHRWAVALVCATFPLLWVGGLVTTTDAGMAVPDWPTTFGYNMFLYPWSWWLSGPWDLFVEHGHRLLASSVGLMTIALLVVLWRSESRMWVRWLGLAALVLVIFQGVLGGMRVLLDERTLAMLHGCTGPLFFAVTVSLAVFTSRRWRETPPGEPAGLPRRNVTGGSLSFIPALAAVTCILAYLQIALGAVLRHVPIGAEPGTFALAVRFHLFLAAILTLHIMLLTWLIWRSPARVHPLRAFASILTALLLFQIALGAGTWIVKFAVPAWAPTWIAASVVVQEGGWLQMHVITAHVAVGSLILAVATGLALYAQRLLPVSEQPVEVPVGRRLEAAL